MAQKGGRILIKSLKKLKSAIAHPITSGLTIAVSVKKVFFRRHECIVIACMPKSGSTFLLNTLSLLTGFKTCFPTSGAGRDDQNLYLPALIELYGKQGVCQLHLKATERNLDLIDQFSIKTIVLVRNIFDVVVSYRDHLHNESTLAPIVWANEQFFELDDTSQLDLIIELAIPWYINFYVSWFSASKEGIINPVWLTYEELTTNPQSTLRRIMDAFGIDKTEVEIQESLEKVDRRKIRFHKGVSGRGRQQLSDTQIQRIIDLTRFYPWVDFSKMGVPE